MFRVFISSSLLRPIIDAECAKPKGKESYLFKMCLYSGRIFTNKPIDADWASQIRDKYKLVIDTSKSDYIKEVIAKHEKVLENPSSLFILDIPDTDARDIEVSYGVLCRGRDNHNVDVLLDIYDEHTPKENESYGHGWHTVLSTLAGVPSNSLLFVDRYLFSNKRASFGDGFANVKEVMDIVLPQRFMGEYHVIILFGIGDKFSKYYDFEDIVAGLEQVRQSIKRDYEIKMEVLGITEDSKLNYNVHNRRIVSNYFVVKMEHKIAAFNESVSTTRQSLTPQVLFTQYSLDNMTSPPLKIIDLVLSALADYSKTLPSLANHSTYEYAVNGKRMEKCMGVKNRIIK